MSYVWPLLTISNYIYLKFKFTTTDLEKRLTIVAFQNSHLAETQVENFPKNPLRRLNENKPSYIFAFIFKQFWKENP